MSNMFLHFPQVIDSRLQNEGRVAVFFWNRAAISAIKFLNKWDDYGVSSG
jgi:hypothetical protein